MRGKVHAGMFARFLLVASLALHADIPTLAQDRIRSILSAGVDYRRVATSDAITTWLQHTTAAPCWELKYRLRIPRADGVLVGLAIGVTYFESNTWKENGNLLDEGLMRILLLDAPVGVEVAIPVAGPVVLSGGLEVTAAYRELGQVVSESGAITMSDFTLGTTGRWGFGLRFGAIFRVLLLADLFSGFPIYGERKYPSAEGQAYSRWPLGVGGSAILEVTAGLVYARAAGRVSRLGEVRFGESEGGLGVEGSLGTEIRLGVELGVRL